MDFLARINAERILVAESNPDDMAYTTRVLEEAGYNVQKAYYVGDALYAVEQGQFDLILVDVHMRDRDQKLLIDHIGALPSYAVAPWIALIDEKSDDAESFLKQGAAAYLRRPLQGQHVLKRVEAVLQGQDVKPSEPKRPSGLEDPTKHLLERRLVEQQTLLALARSLSAVLDLDTLLTQVVDAAVRLSNAEEGMLLLPDDDGKALYIRAVKGIDSETARNFRIKTEDTLAGQVFRSGQPIVVGDQGWQKVKTEYLVKSLLYVPLSSKGQIIGVLGLNNKHTDRTFDQHDSDLLQALAAHAAIAIENARLYEESILRTHELSTLVQASQAANSTLAIDRVLSIIASQLIGALGLSQCIISEWSPQDQRLDTLSNSYRALWRPTAGPALTSKTDPAIEQAFNQQRSIVVSPDNDPSEHPLAAWLPHRYQARTVIYIPLLVQHQPLGVVKLCYMDEDQHSDRYTANVQKLALESIFRLTDNHIEQHQSSLFRTAQQIIDISKADLCEIALWNPDKRQFNVALSYGEAIWSGSSKPGIDLMYSPQLTQILTDQQPFTGTATDEMRYLAERKYGQSFLGVPLVIKGTTAGLVLLVDTLHDRYFPRREVELAQALILQAANALGNARLYRDLETSLAELHLTQSKLVQTARLSAMGELAAAVAHQINNPLTTILVDTEMMLQDITSDNPDTEALEAISRAGKRAHEVVRRLLGMARQYSSEDTIEAVNVNESIQNTLTLVKSHIQQGNVALIVQLEGDLPPVTGIRGQLEDVWLNLLLNARDAVANRSNSRIGISSSYYTGDEFVEICVWDNGTGIRPEQKAQIFEPFFTTKPPGEGTGLGLHICRQIVEKCKGSINVESAYNEGTRFMIRLPVYHR